MSQGATSEGETGQNLDGVDSNLTAPRDHQMDYTPEDCSERTIRRDIPPNREQVELGEDESQGSEREDESFRRKGKRLGKDIVAAISEDRWENREFPKDRDHGRHRSRPNAMERTKDIPMTKENRYREDDEEYSPSGHWSIKPKSGSMERWADYEENSSPESREVWRNRDAEEKLLRKDEALARRPSGEADLRQPSRRKTGDYGRPSKRSFVTDSQKGKILVSPTDPAKATRQIGETLTEFNWRFLVERVGTPGVGNQQAMEAYRWSCKHEAATNVVLGRPSFRDFLSKITKIAQEEDVVMFNPMIAKAMLQREKSKGSTDPEEPPTACSYRSRDELYDEEECEAQRIKELKREREEIRKKTEARIAQITKILTLEEKKERRSKDICWRHPGRNHTTEECFTTKKLAKAKKEQKDYKQREDGGYDDRNGKNPRSRTSQN